MSKKKKKHESHGDIIYGHVIYGDVKVHDINAPSGNIDNSGVSNAGRANDSNEKDDMPYFIVALIVIAVIAFVICILISVFASKEKMDDLNEAKEQKFITNTENIEKAGIPYIEYIITSDPSNNGYHIRPYPYLMYKEEGQDRIIPLRNLFTQPEYTEEKDGECILLQEDIELLLNMEQVNVGCILAISYVEGSDSVKDVYALGNGKLLKAEEDIVTQVLDAYNHLDDHNTIDMINWPGNLDTIKQMIFD